ncbi:PelD GGDEF domain-containing protein [Photobacterium rosenbergii]|uniref:PelD GGDEF domain-containing protein n=1 Tax=Photobacterium rosenbergii TaxID=294936 RepID=UPI001C9A2005|nr:PelD GGDEF domain-containing protein [Photobacterium rosenbergii]MBY5946511.1 GAF domain-containing protein [Photobacterium rosenbergii]
MDKKTNNKAILGFSRSSYVWLETLVIAILSIYVWVESDSLAPTSTEHNFFWPLFGPMLIALRYGFAKGFICALFTTAGLATIMNASGMLDYYPLSLAIGTIMVAMIAGEFHDYWHNINQKHILDHQYMAQKLDSFTQNYHLLKVSHDQLEQRTAGQTVSLRSSISALHKIAAKHAEHRLEYLGQPYLHLMADIGGLEVAGIYKVTDDKIDTKAAARVGDHHRLVENDAMLEDMLATKKLLSPAKLEANQVHQSRYQLCIPLLDTKGTLQAAIIAENAKFFMLTPANVALLSLVANYAADLLSDEIITPILQPHQNDLFMNYLKRASYNKRHYGADSSVVVCFDSAGKHQQELDSTISYRRGADVYWSCRTKKGNAALAVLLPLTTAYEAQQYIVRLRELLKDQLGEDINDIDIIGPLSMSTDRPEIRKLMNELGAYDEDMVISSDHSL